MSQRSLPIDFEMTVDEVMRRWPATIRVFLDFRMGCVGCPIGGFHTVYLQTALNACWDGAAYRAAGAPSPVG